MQLTIERIDSREPAVQERVREFLAPHEPHAMFILGNLGSERPADVYAAIRDGRWAGVCGYYGTFKSLIPFSTEPDVTRAMVRRMARLHPTIEYLNGIDYVAEPAYQVLQSLGYRPCNDPHQVFMELEGLPPPHPAEPMCRMFRPDDAEQTTRLLRVMNGQAMDGPVSQEERCRVLLNPDRWVLLQDGRVVSTAATSGLGLRACQIIGVATHPDYRGRGYAKAVCGSLIRAMSLRGADRSLLFTGHENLSAQRCYQGMGFRITGKYYVAKFEPPV